MDHFERMFNGRFAQHFNLKTMFKANDISDSVQQHLVHVYSSLAATVFAAAVGVYADIIWDVCGYITLFGSVGLMLALYAWDRKQTIQRLGLLIGIGFVQGVNLGPLVSAILETDPSIVVTAFLGTTAIFACLTGSALLEKRRHYMYLGGFISSAFVIMSLMSLANIFVRSVAMYTLHLYMGLFVFLGYVLFDTQMIIEKASYGDYDFVLHSMDLFLDFVSIFVRILVILKKNADKNREREENNKRRR